MKDKKKTGEKVSVTIGRLNIRLKGVSAHTARAAAANLGSKLLEHLAGMEGNIKENPGARLEAVDAGTITLQKGENVQDRIVSGIVKKVAAETASSGTGG